MYQCWASAAKAALHFGAAAEKMLLLQLLQTPQARLVLHMDLVEEAPPLRTQPLVRLVVLVRVVLLLLLNISHHNSHHVKRKSTGFRAFFMSSNFKSF
jgi:hypothetical protein